MNHDICFCMRDDCPRVDCYRHRSHAPVGIPYSISRLHTDDVSLCEWYLPGARAGTPKLNLNTATEEELRELDCGLSTIRIYSILSYREKHGGFKSVPELRKCRGIGKGLCEKLSRLVYVEEGL